MINVNKCNWLTGFLFYCSLSFVEYFGEFLDGNFLYFCSYSKFSGKYLLSAVMRYELNIFFPVFVLCRWINELYAHAAHYQNKLDDGCTDLLYFSYRNLNFLICSQCFSLNKFKSSRFLFFDRNNLVFL